MIKLERSSAVYVDHMGSDKTVVNAARVSFSADNIEVPFNEKDKKLISYLAKHNHWSPFAHTSVQLKITAPIFIARQLVKHQVGGVWNEVSRRYVSYEPSFFDMGVWRGKPVNAKQGSTGVVEDQDACDDLMIKCYEACNDTYNKLLDIGVCPEQARAMLPLGSMTEWYWTGSLMFWARVCNQRIDGHAQNEAEEVARAISPICEKLFPISWKALMDQTTSTQ